MSKSKRAIDGIREALIQGLKEGTAPWQKPWKPGDTDVSQPYNASSGRVYTGWSNITFVKYISVFSDGLMRMNRNYFPCQLQNELKN